MVHKPKNITKLKKHIQGMLISSVRATSQQRKKIIAATFNVMKENTAKGISLVFFAPVMQRPLQKILLPF
jgi:hypothetical protein